MVKATMPYILNPHRNIFMRLYGFVEEVVTMCLVYKIWGLYSYFDETLQLCRTGHDNVSHTKMRALTLILFELSPL